MPEAKTPFSEILAWSSQQPVWQQEAIRRILTRNTSLPQRDTEDLADHCVGAQAGDKVTLKPLAAADLPLADAASAPVALTGFGLPTNVNALRPDQWLPVGPQLTVIFGSNATGKTGYARLLKKAFRARIVEELQPDVRAEKPVVGKPGATFEFKAGAAAPARVIWNSATPLPHDVASRFAVLDAKCGQAYVLDNELQIAPQGLDVLPRLVETLDRVKDELRKRRAACAIDKRFLVGVDPSTASARYVMGVGATSQLAAIVEALAFSDDDKKRLTEAKVQLGQLQTQSPKQLAAQHEAATKSARRLREQIVRRAALVSATQLGKVEDARDALKKAEVAAAKVKTLAADQKVLGTVGNDEWLGLIEAAAAFVRSTEAEGLDGLGKCPLCLEALSPAARTRLKRFWSVVTDAAEAQRAQAEAELERLVAELHDAESSDDDPVLALAASLGVLDESLLASVETAVKAAAAAAQKVLSGKATKQVEFGAVLEKLSRLDQAMAKSAATTSNASDISKAIAGLAATVAELEARQTLFARIEDIEQHLVQLRQAALLEAASAGIKSLAATKKSAELNETFLTDSYRLGVEAELHRLGFARPVPVLVQQGEKGKVRILALANPRLKSVTADQVFSEGERTAIALASFFSELSLAPAQVGLVFDDPISSLDDRIRARVADRLAAEARVRQVIVFTHDLGFLSELTRAAAAHRVQAQCCELSSTSTDVGVVADHGPWDAQDVASRMKRLGAILVEGQELDRFVGLLQSTWERFIEEKLLAGALDRSSRQIKPDSLRSVCFDPGLVEDVVTELNALSGIEGQLSVAEAGERLKALADAVSRHRELRRVASAVRL